MENKLKVNRGWVLTLIAWILSSIVIPFLPEIIKFNRSMFGYPLMEYVATSGLFAAFFSLIWIPVGIGAGKLYKTDGTRASLILVGISFLILLLIWLFIFTFLWNG